MRDVVRELLEDAEEALGRGRFFTAATLLARVLVMMGMEGEAAYLRGSVKVGARVEPGYLEELLAKAKRATGKRW